MVCRNKIFCPLLRVGHREISMSTWLFENWVFAHFGPLSLDNRKSDFRFLDAVRETSGPYVYGENLSEIALHSFEKSAIKIWKSQIWGWGIFGVGYTPFRWAHIHLTFARYRAWDPSTYGF